jgi:hypothetical protein
MSKLTTRIALSVLISLVVVVGIYTTVFGASSNTSDTRAGSHLVSGARVNLDHYREANPAPVPVQASEFMRSNGYGGCEHENQTSPND